MIKIVSPEGEVYEVENLHAFAKEHGIDHGNLVRVVNLERWHAAGYHLYEHRHMDIRPGKKGMDMQPREFRDRNLSKRLTTLWKVPAPID